MVNLTANISRLRTIRVKTLEFFLFLVLLLIVLFFITKSPVLLYFAIGIAGVGLFLNKISSLIYLGWTKLSQFLAFVMTRLVLSIVFFLVLFPVSLIYRMTKKDPLKLKPNRYPSLFETRSKHFTSADLENMW
jgi:hypothetical protein